MTDTRDHNHAPLVPEDLQPIWNSVFDRLREEWDRVPTVSEVEAEMEKAREAGLL